MTTDDRPQTNAPADLLEVTEEERQHAFVEVRDEILAASDNAAAAIRPGDQPFAERVFAHAVNQVGPATSDEIELLGMQAFVAKIAEELAESERESGGPIWPRYIAS